MKIQELNKALGNIDLYLLDQLLKGRFSPSMKVLDAGCGEGRNLMYFIQNEYKVYGIDNNPDAIRMLQFVARSLNPALSRDNFVVGNLEAMPYASNEFDVVICSAVLHFAKDAQQFHNMLAEIVRVSKPGAIIFIRTASSIGIEDKIGLPENGGYNLPDGSFRFLIHRNDMEEIPALFGLDYIEPFKTVNVADLRCMSNLVLKKL